jgi:hypothetical protein
LTNLSVGSFASAVVSITVHPNPTISAVTLSMILQRPESIRIAITDLLGREVWATAMAKYPAGKSEVNIPLQTVAAGQYFYHVRNDKGQVLASGRVLKE